jgi:hypothetical protein
MSQPSLNISMRSKKQHIRLWFECLQTCHSQPEYSDNLVTSKDFYKEWGDVTNIKFDDWWRDHKYLFQDEYVREVTRVSNTPNTITLSIPLNEKSSVITSEVKKIVEQRQTEKLVEMGMNPDQLKSKSLSLGKYGFTQKEIKGLFHYVNLEIFKIFLELDKPPINRNFLIEVRKSFDTRVRSKLRNSVINLPYMDDFERLKSNSDFEDVIRSIRRSIKMIEKTLTKVSKDRFP